MWTWRGIWVQCRSICIQEMTYCAGTGTPLATTLSQINPAHVLMRHFFKIHSHNFSPSGFQTKMFMPLSSYPSLITLIGTLFMPLLFISIRIHMFLCIVYANAFQRSYINNNVYNVDYFYLAFISSEVIFLKHRYWSNFKMFPNVWEPMFFQP
jgi:hypothetical protein